MVHHRASDFLVIHAKMKICAEYWLEKVIWSCVRSYLDSAKHRKWADAQQGRCWLGWISGPAACLVLVAMCSMVHEISLRGIVKRWKN